ncbi:MAG: hypothetical protein H6733_05445 [Alphaproteobacteria bacterium]|nr:hypothetical protein [Alphaproteobacteria bacterium]
MPLLLTLLLGLAVPAHAEEPQDAPVAPANDAPAAALARAREAYALGDFDAAHDGFLALVQRARNVGDVPAEVESEAWIYLGEMQYLDGNQAGAEARFRMVLQRDPTYTVSPVAHPLEVIGFFDVVRTAVTTEREAAREGIKPYPWWGYTPLGVPQFKQRRPVRGTLYAFFQVGFAATSVASWFIVDAAVKRIDTDQSAGDPVGVANSQLARRRATDLRNGLSYSFATAFYVTWAASIADGGLSWRKDQVVLTGVGVAPSRDGVMVSVSGRF